MSSCRAGRPLLCSRAQESPHAAVKAVRVTAPALPRWRRPPAGRRRLCPRRLPVELWSLGARATTAQLLYAAARYGLALILVGQESREIPQVVDTSSTAPRTLNGLASSR